MTPSDDCELRRLRRQNEALLSRLQSGQACLRDLRSQFTVQPKPGPAGDATPTAAVDGSRTLVRPTFYYRTPTAELEGTPTKSSTEFVADDNAITRSSNGVESPVNYRRLPTTNLMCTPPTKSITALPTPTRSILRRRKIIDDNVKVTSGYDPVPFTMSEWPRHTPAGSCAEGHPTVSDAPQQNGGSGLEVGGERGKRGVLPGVVERLEERGNARPAKDPSAAKPPPPPTPASDGRRAAQPTNQHLPLLGYDWIASNLDNDKQLTISDQSEDFFDRIRNFRLLNRDDCVINPALRKPVDPGRPISPEVKDPTHTCIHGYSINERLFTEPMNTDEDGKSVCPICLAVQKKTTRQSPGFVRVSIPRAGLLSPYQLKPHRRRSFDPTDSCALSEHCLAGWECSQPASMKPASNIDLKHAANGIKSKLTVTMDKAQLEAAGICF